MQYPTLLTLIDAELERLQEARRILSLLVADMALAPDLIDLSRRSKAPRRAVLAARSTGSITGSADIVATSHVSADPDATQTSASPSSRRPRRSPTRTPRARASASVGLAAPRALGPARQTGPIFVPAAQLAYGRQDANAAASVSGADPALGRPATNARPAEALTAEGLAQRWLQRPPM